VLLWGVSEWERICDDDDDDGLVLDLGACLWQPVAMEHRVIANFGLVSVPTSDQSRRRKSILQTAGSLVCCCRWRNTSDVTDQQQQ